MDEKGKEEWGMPIRQSNWNTSKLHGKKELPTPIPARLLKRLSSSQVDYPIVSLPEVFRSMPFEVANVRRQEMDLSWEKERFAKENHRIARDVRRRDPSSNICLCCHAPRPRNAWVAPSSREMNEAYRSPCQIARSLGRFQRFGRPYHKAWPPEFRYSPLWEASEKFPHLPENPGDFPPLSENNNRVSSLLLNNSKNLYTRSKNSENSENFLPRPNNSGNLLHYSKNYSGGFLSWDKKLICEAYVLNSTDLRSKNRNIGKRALHSLVSTERVSKNPKNSTRGVVTKHWCKYCGKKFRFIGNRRSHERTHTGEKPYICGVCGKGFAQASNLKRHNKIHFKHLDQNSADKYQKKRRLDSLRL
ncbi:hypothetical protein AAMO2058_000851400 [Amorphochlora amoebiformis]